MGNEVVNDAKDCCKEDNQKEESGCCLLSILESAGQSVGNAVRGAENIGSAALQGAAAGVGLNISKETADAVARGVVAAGVVGGAALAIDQAVKHPEAAAAAAGVAVGAGAVGAAIAEMMKDKGKDGKAGCAADCATDMAIGAAIGAAAGAATGDLTRAATLAALGAITGCAARCAAEMCKPGCCVKPADPVSLAKDLGKTVLDHVTNRPVEAAAEGIIAGPAGVVGGALARKMMEQKDCCGNVLQKAMKGAAEEIGRQAEMLKKMFEPKLPLIEMGPGVGEAVKKAAEITTGPGLAPVAIEAGKVVGEAAAAAAKQAGAEIDQHRKDNPTTSQVERVVGSVLGGPIAGKPIGTAIEYGDVKARQAYNWVKSWFE